MNSNPVLPALRSPRHIDLNDRVGLIEWSYVTDESGQTTGLQCILKYGAGDSPRRICVGVALDLPENLWNVIEQDAIVVALRETLADSTKDAPMFGYTAP